MRSKATLSTLAAVLFALLLPTPPASAVLDQGEPGPFRLEMRTPDPSGISSAWSRGSVSFTVPSGTELILFGMEQEPFMKIAKEGGVYYNEHSSTWWGIVPGGADRMAETAENFEFAVPPDWVLHDPGQTLRTFENRIDYYDNSIHPDVADGTVLYEFKYKVLLDGAVFTYEGAMIFDSSLDQAFAASMKSRGLDLLGDRYGSIPDTPGGTRWPLLAPLAAAAAVVVGLAYVIHRRRSATANTGN